MKNELSINHQHRTPINDLFSDWEKRAFNLTCNNPMRVDITEGAKDYRVKAELPGFKKSNISLDYDHDTLRIEAKKDLKLLSKRKILCNERTSGNLFRAFYLPNVNFVRIKADFRNGVLSVNLPKLSKESNDHGIEIE